MARMDNDTPPAGKRRKVPRKATPRSLENGALYYLERFSTSAENLRQVLMRRVAKSARHHELDTEACHAAIDDIIHRFIRSGLLDDAAYARARVTTFRRRGDAARAIAMKLLAKGVAKDVIDEALRKHAEDEDESEPELAAALRFAKRRKLGPHNTKGDRVERRDKDLAALARAGFSYDVAQRVIDD